MVTGSGKVFGRPAFAFSQDFTGGGALGGFSIGVRSWRRNPGLDDVCLRASLSGAVAVEPRPQSLPCPPACSVWWLAV